MRNRRTNFASFHRARVQGVRSGRLTHDCGSVPSPFSKRSGGVCRCERFGLFRPNFDGVVAWGLFFLLDEEVQRRLIKKVAGVLQSGGRMLFTAPKESGSWPDVMTGRSQFSLGCEEYRKALEAEGMLLVGTHRDEGENHYYFAQKA
jgi:hypothetical protein